MKKVFLQLFGIIRALFVFNGPHELAGSFVPEEQAQLVKTKGRARVAL
jgi:hypothetical protein